MTSTYKTNDGYTLYLIDNASVPVWADAPMIEDSDLIFWIGLHGRPITDAGVEIPGSFTYVPRETPKPGLFFLSGFHCAHCATRKADLDRMQASYGPDSYFDICCETEVN